MLPSEALHVTDLSEAVPTTVAVNGNVPPTTDEADDGEIVTEVTPGPDGVGLGGVGFGADVTMTVADADLLGSLTLVAVTVPVPAFDGAVKSPRDVMLPMDAVHVTDSLAIVP